MRLKMIKAPRVGQTDMLVQTVTGMKEFKVGQLAQLSEAEGKEILSGNYGHCFSVEQESAGQPEAVKAPIKAGKRKVTVDSAAEEEATKMMADYNIK